jgi:hypothetical protein
MPGLETQFAEIFGGTVGFAPAAQARRTPTLDSPEGPSRVLDSELGNLFPSGLQDTDQAVRTGSLRDPFVAAMVSTMKNARTTSCVITNGGSVCFGAIAPPCVSHHLCASSRPGRERVHAAPDYAPPEPSQIAPLLAQAESASMIAARIVVASLTGSNLQIPGGPVPMLALAKKMHLAPPIFPAGASQWGRSRPCDSCWGRCPWWQS